MALSKRHHYIPRYYLKRFENEFGEMWRLDIETGNIVKGDHDSFGLQRHWNSLENPQEGYAKDWAEKRISEIDGFASALITKMLSGTLPKDIRALAYAISFMQNNNPHVMRHLEENHADEIKNWSEDWKLIVRINAALENGISYVPKHYSLYEIDEGIDARFLTSSNPLLEFSNKPAKLLPLSSKHCLFLSYDSNFEGFERTVTSCDREMVLGINRRSIQNAWQYVYSTTPDFQE